MMPIRRVAYGVVAGLSLGVTGCGASHYGKTVPVAACVNTRSGYLLPTPAVANGREASYWLSLSTDNNLMSGGAVVEVVLPSSSHYWKVEDVHVMNSATVRGTIKKWGQISGVARAKFCFVGEHAVDVLNIKQVTGRADNSDALTAAAGVEVVSPQAVQAGQTVVALFRRGSLGDVENAWAPSTVTWSALRTNAGVQRPYRLTLLMHWKDYDESGYLFRLPADMPTGRYEVYRLPGDQRSVDSVADAEIGFAIVK